MTEPVQLDFNDVFIKEAHEHFSDAMKHFSRFMIGQSLFDVSGNYYDREHRTSELFSAKVNVIHLNQRDIHGEITFNYKKETYWHMSYTGYCQRDVMSTFEDVLGRQYESGVYHGGRGPAMVEVDGLIYRNVPSLNSFTGFTLGHETMLDLTGEPVAKFLYHAKWLAE